jgi:hypothetical protein
MIPASWKILISVAMAWSTVLSSLDSNATSDIACTKRVELCQSGRYAMRIACKMKREDNESHSLIAYLDLEPKFL